MMNEPNDWKLPWDAACRCGKVRMRISAPPMLTMACHCRGCQRMTASAYSLSVAVPATGFAVTQGEPEVGGLHGTSKHFHCGYCKSWLFTRPEGMDEMVNVRASMLELPQLRAWLVVWAETYTSEGFAWAKTGAKHSFPKFPEVGAFGPILEEFAKSAPRP